MDTTSYIYFKESEHEKLNIEQNLQRWITDKKLTVIGDLSYPFIVEQKKSNSFGIWVIGFKKKTIQ